MIGKDLTISHHNSFSFNRNNQSNHYFLHVSNCLIHSLKSFSSDCTSFLVTPRQPVVFGPLSSQFPGVSSAAPDIHHSCALTILCKFHFIFFPHLVLWCWAVVSIPVPPLAQLDFIVTIDTFHQPGLLGTDNILTPLFLYFPSPLSQSHTCSIKNACDVTHLNII